MGLPDLGGNYSRDCAWAVPDASPFLEATHANRAPTQSSICRAKCAIKRVEGKSDGWSVWIAISQTVSKQTRRALTTVPKQLQRH